MRRLLVIFLLLIFPLEMTFAAVDSCCNYTSVARHLPCQEAVRADQALASAHALSPIDADCSLCALGVIAYLPQAAPAAFLPLPGRDTLSPAAALPFASCLSPRPDRPQWLLPA